MTSSLIFNALIGLCIIISLLVGLVLLFRVAQRAGWTRFLPIALPAQQSLITIKDQRFLDARTRLVVCDIGPKRYVLLMNSNQHQLLDHYEHSSCTDSASTH
jgi:hypothetical protein